jgi:hypothetical protein
VKTKKKAVRWRYYACGKYVMRQSGDVREYFNHIIQEWRNGSDEAWSLRDGDRPITAAEARRIIKGGGK